MGYPTDAERYADAAGRVEDAVLATVLAIARARSLQSAGQSGAALAVLAAARGRVDRQPPPVWLERQLIAAAAAVWTASGRPDRALQSIADAGHSGPEISLELARANLVSGERGRCVEAVVDVLRRADLPRGLRIEACLLRAAASLEGGDQGTAREAVQRALQIAAPERVRRPILDAPARLRGFVLHDALLAPSRDWLEGPAGWGDAPRPAGLAESASGRTPGDGGPWAPYQARAPEPTPADSDTAQSGSRSQWPVVIEPLTVKEQEVLAHLAALLSTEEIAQMMFVSINTVKSHVRSILRKFGVARRNAAIRRARELQLV
jgi:LuxR family maltose regulon positive regulatory protein